jgi:hypothetical protein
MAKHRHNDREAKEERQRAEDESGRDDQAPLRNLKRILARSAKRSANGRDKADATIKHKREGNDTDAKGQRGETEADQAAQDNEQPAAAARQNVAKKG